MGRRVWKVDIPVDDRIHDYDLPHGARPVHVACQHYDAPAPVGIVQVWFEVHDDATTEQRRFTVYGTGHDVKGTYIGTGMEMSGRLVWHVYERKAGD